MKYQLIGIYAVQGPCHYTLVSAFWKGQYVGNFIFRIPHQEIIDFVILF